MKFRLGIACGFPAQPLLKDIIEQAAFQQTEKDATNDSSPHGTVKNEGASCMQGSSRDDALKRKND